MSTESVWTIADLNLLALQILQNTSEHPQFFGKDQRQMQVLCVAEEVGEFVGAYRRWSGQARRAGTFEEMQDEWADIIISAFVAARALGIDPKMAIANKQKKILSRGWVEEKT